MNPSTCPSCGAHLSAGAERCTLCGTRPGEEVAPTDLPAVEAGAAKAEAGPAEDAGASASVHCAECGTRSAAYARYCWKCGEALVHAAGPPAAPPDVAAAARHGAAGGMPARSSAAGRQALLLLAGGAAAVVLLFAITQLSGRAEPPRPQAEATTGETQAAALPRETRLQISALEERIAATADGAERLVLRQELVEALVGAGAFAQAGEVQEAVAREVSTVDAWAEAGSFFLAHVLRTDSPEQVIFAERSARAFEQALELRPGDLDIKTDLATAYRYHPDDPMRAVALIQEVLEQDEDHPRARFNYGVMLAEIGRNDQARTQFEHVVNTPAADEFVQDRAREMLDNMPPSR